MNTLINIVIIICTIVNIILSIYVSKKGKALKQDRQMMEEAAKDIFQMVVSIREDIEEMRPKDLHFPTQEEIEDVMDEKEDEPD